MKHSATTRCTAFVPVTVTITCEAQNELDALYSIFNHSSISDAAAEVFGISRAGLDIGQTLRRSGASYDKFAAYAAALKQDVNS